MSHHNAFRAASRNMTVVCVLHSHSERLSLQRLKKRLQHALPNLDVMVSQTDNDPFDIC
jgi:putative NIF3 family GTP cyclohydrolase 1 type 2